MKLRKYIETFSDFRFIIENLELESSFSKQILLEKPFLTNKKEIENQYNRIKSLLNSISRIDFLLNDYGMILNFGVEPERIPYTPNSGKKQSKYIDALKKYVTKRMGKSGKEAERIAFAIAKKQKKDGMPTKGSFKYSKNGRRTGAIDATLAESNDELTQLINNTFEQYIYFIFTEAFATITNTLKGNTKIILK